MNVQAFGDVIHGINAARRYKQEHPDHLVSYVIRENFQLTTNESFSGVTETLEVLEHQPWLDSVGLALVDNQGKVRGLNLNKKEEGFKKVDNFIIHASWYSDLGISKSANLPIKHLISEELFNDTDIQLHVPVSEIENDKIRISTSGPLDWNRKLQSENTRLELMFGIKDILESKGLDYEINMLGVDVGNYTLFQSLQILKRHNLFIGPMGSLVHSAAALGVDTISVPSVFPAEYDCPEFYMTTGWHKTVNHRSENHCGSYQCVATKLSTEDTKSFGNPPASFGFWPRHCPYTKSTLSCTKTVQAKDILDKFESWINDRS